MRDRQASLGKMNLEASCHGKYPVVPEYRLIPGHQLMPKLVQA
jgi:hypothetical protein